MMMLLETLAASAISFAFICIPADDTRHANPYVVSFQQNGDRIDKIWVIWPDGSQSGDNWRGTINAEGYSLSAERRFVDKRIELKISATENSLATLTNYYAVTGGHVPVESTDTAECTVRSAEMMKEAA